MSGVEYGEYVQQIRQEYIHVSEPMFREGRAAVLRHLLALSALYKSQIFRQRFDSIARENMTRELAELTS